MLTDKNLISVVIPAYQRPELLDKTLRSVFSQTLEGQVKVIVIDDHSPEPLSQHLMKNWRRVTWVRNKTNLGAWASRNQGFKLVKSKYVVFLDADDIWEKDFLEISQKKLKTSSLIGTTTLTQVVFDKKFPLSQKVKILALSAIKDFFQVFFFIFNHQEMARTAFYLCQLSHVLFKTKYIREIKFDGDYSHGGEDWKFMLEVTDHGQIGIIPRRLVRYRYHVASTTRLPIHLKLKWKSYKQIFPAVRKRHMKGFMITLLKYYVKIFEDAYNQSITKNT